MGLKKLFFQIWNNRKHQCFACDAYLGEEPLAHYFAHILSRGAYPKFKLVPWNIVLMCLNCHHEFDFGDCNLERFNSVNEIKQQLKEHYYDETKPIPEF